MAVACTLVMLSTLLENSDFVQTIELWPPSFNFEGSALSIKSQFEWLSERMEILGRYFDAFHVADLKNLKRRYLDPVMTSVYIKGKYPWLEVVPTISARDRNRKTLYGAIASALHSGIENLIAVWGDRFSTGESAYSGNVYDISGVSQLVEIAREVQRMTTTRDLCVLTPIDLTRARDEKYLALARGREKSSSDVFVSQVFLGEPERYLEMIDRVRADGIRSPILHNVFPLLGYEDALDISVHFRGCRWPRISGRPSTTTEGR
ncbi:MAG: methylenetetrahydrofolate reductase [Thaumarchaeota archaeon]|nr:methylenetetrahydrofolate reductase [Nitrososphaerota archaeon]